MDFSISQIILLIFIGILAGTINVIAGGGSFLTLPALIFVGVPPLIANASNRVAILMQNIVGIRRYHVLGVRPKIEYPLLFILVIPSAIAGAWLSTLFSNQEFKTILAIIMLFAAFMTLLKTGKKVTSNIPTNRLIIYGGYILIGLYGGFIQAGVGFLILMVMALDGHNLIEGNAIKLIIAVVFTAVSIIVFTLNHQINWMAGFLLGLGNIGGAFIGTHFVVKSKQATLEKLVQIAIIIMAFILIVRR
jgi:uncharacterized protein